MHLLLSAEERNWCKTNTMGWPIKDGCPDKIKESIEKKKNILKDQFRKGDIAGVVRILHE